MIKIIVQSIYYQLLMFLRIKQAVFFTIVFPIFLFIIFGSIWGTGNKDYIPFLLSGLIGMVITSDGLFAIGFVIKEYYMLGLIKYLRKLPFNIIFYISSLIISRVISLTFVVFMLCLVAKFIFGYSVNIFEIVNFFCGLFIGLFIFSFIGLVIAFSGIKQTVNVGIINFIFFIFLFTSNTYFPVSKYNYTIGLIGDILPLNPVLAIMRAEGFKLTILFWLIIPVIIFYYLFKNIKFNR